VDEVRVLRAIVFRKDLEENLFVCPKLPVHFRVNAKKRLELLLTASGQSTTREWFRPIR